MRQKRKMTISHRGNTCFLSKARRGQKSSKGFETEVAIIGEHNVNNVNSLCSFGKRNFNGKNDNNVLSQIQCAYTNADSFLDKIEEFKTRFIENKPNIYNLAPAKVQDREISDTRG